MSKLSKSDMLETDKPISNQNWVCLSFVSPEYEIKNRELWEFQQFVKNYNFNKSMQKMGEFLNFLSYKYSLKGDDLQTDFKEFIDSEKDSLNFSVEDDFKNFKDQFESQMMDEYNKKHNFQTSVRGVKVRGVFSTQEEASMRAKLLREVDPNHDIYCAPVGAWLPFHPEAYKTGNVEYLEEELNNLMHKKQENEANAKVEFERRLKESKVNAIEENVKNAEKHGNVLTQTINEKGELVSINDVNSQEKVLGVNASMDEIKNVLFEGDNIVTEKKSDHGLSAIMESMNKDKDEDDLNKTD